MKRQGTIRVLYSFPQKIGAGRVCYTAWEQVRGLHAAGATVTAFPGAVHRALPPDVTVRTTLSRGSLRLPYRAVGMTRACQLHDMIVARRLKSLAGSVDVVHAWPLGARRTLAEASRLGIPTFLERPNAHTGYAFDVVAEESARLGVVLPRGSEHAFDEKVLSIEEEEYALADRLLCPSEFVVKTFRDRGYTAEKLVRHVYGFDGRRFHPEERDLDRPFTVLFVGYAAVRKGLHIALDAWLRSPASRDGRFLIAGDIMPAYAERLAGPLGHESVRRLGHRDDVPELMRQSDALVLPSLEEGFGLVCVEAMASGCVPLVSEACTDVCRQDDNALVHAVGDVAALAGHIAALHADAGLRERLRSRALSTAPDLTWDAAGHRLLEAYQDVL